MQDILEWTQGCIILLVEKSQVQVISDFPSDPARCWQMELPAPSHPFAELVVSSSRVSGNGRPKVGLYPLTCGDILVQREYFTNHYETGLIYRIDRVGMDGRALGCLEVFSAFPSGSWPRWQIDILESGSALLLRLVDEQGRVLREQTLN